MDKMSTVVWGFTNIPEKHTGCNNIGLRRIELHTTCLLEKKDFQFLSEGRGKENMVTWEVRCKKLGLRLPLVRDLLTLDH